jgi:2,3-bisphosphoglycerate-independent phosphoglycerate mutase
MSSAELTGKLVAAIESGKYDTIICNYPNGDMVGHTGVMEAAVKAVEALDHCVEQVAKAVESVGGQLLITADHGNAEQMRDPSTGQAHTAHTNLPVPLIYVGDKSLKAVEGGKLSDIAPTMLTLMGMEIQRDDWQAAVHRGIILPHEGKGDFFNHMGRETITVISQASVLRQRAQRWRIAVRDIRPRG